MVRQLSCLLMAIMPITAAFAAVAWQPITVTDGDQRLDDMSRWYAYGGAKTSRVEVADLGTVALHVETRAEALGGFSVVVTPRGGFGNRARVSLRHRVLSGGPVTVYAGPNTWNQVAATLAGPQWQMVQFEVGLLHDFPLVLHVVQPPGGVFEVADLQASACGAAPEVRRRLGPVDMTVVAIEGGDTGRIFALQGEAQVIPAEASPDATGLNCRISLTGPASVGQSLGVIPAGSIMRLRGSARATGGPMQIGLRLGGKTLASVPLKTDQNNVVADCVLEEDGAPQWYVSSEAAGQAEVTLTGVQALVTLPDPLGPAVVRLPPERRPITLANPDDPKTVLIRPPWPGLTNLKVHLEYTSRWGYKAPDTYESVLSSTGDDLKLTWHFANDPVEYATHWRVTGPNEVAVEATLTNGGAETVQAFAPGFCVQTQGVFAPHVFAYTIIPVKGQPLRLDLGTSCHPTAEPWPRQGWMRAGYEDSAAHRERLAQGTAWQPPPSWIREVGDVPLLARRLPGRDAWIAWSWPTAAGYFGNTQAPCMHMDPVFPDVPAGQTVTMRGKLRFFEGTWEQLYAATLD